MRCVYINLDAEHRRRASVESNFQKTRLPNWSLARFRAIDTAHVHEHGVAGSLTQSEKACFLSHRQVIEQSIDQDGPVYILEDDAIFGIGTCATIEQLLRSDLDDKEWDILFTDVGVDSTKDMAELLRLRSGFRQETISNAEPTIFDLRSLPSFFGASAYLVNASSKKKLYALLTSESDLNVEYDTFLRQLIFQAQIKGLCLFPFITSVAPEADVSAIQTGTGHMIRNAFRRLLWRESGVDITAGTDHWPVDDLALQEAIRIAFGLAAPPDRATMVQIAEDWRPWRGVAARVLRDYYLTLTQQQQVPVG
jgi:GR25 family glycosyltransferase involved in LPS biosynthesis